MDSATHQDAGGSRADARGAYAGKIGIGFVGCRDAVPHLQRLAVSAADALDELERT